MYNGIVFIGPLGSGKDYIIGKLSTCLTQSYMDYYQWQVGIFYYKYLSKELGITVKEIYDDKPNHRSRLQEIGNTDSIVKLGVNFSIQRYETLWPLDIMPIVLGRRPDEALALQKCRANVIFIEASKETRKTRILKRDGQEPTEAQLDHPVEPKYEDFKNIANEILINEHDSGELMVNFNTKTRAIEFANHHSRIIVPLC